MVYPSASSEKGISKYSIDLINSLRSRNIDVEDITYNQGKPKKIFFKLINLKGIVHIQHEYNLLGYFGIPFLIIYLLLQNKKLITTMHTVISQKEDFIGESLKTFFRRIFYKVQNYLIRKSCKKIIVHSDYFKKILVEEYKFGIKQVSVLPHAIKEGIITSNKKESRKELGLYGNIFLMIGTMNPYHDYEAVVNVAEKIGKKVLIVTSASSVNYRDTHKLNSSLDSLKKSIKGKEEFVELREGYIEYDKWWKYFSACDLVLLPYRGGVGCGVFSDCMAMRKPVVSSKVPYFQCIEKKYKCIKTTDNFPQEIEECMKPENYNKMVKECERYIKDNGLTPISKKYKNIYGGLNEK